MPVVPGGVVDEDTDFFRAEIGFDGSDGAFDFADVAQVGMIEGDWVRRLRRKPGGKRLARLFRYIDEGDLGALLSETFNECCAYAGATAGDQDRAIPEIGKLCLCFGQVRLPSRNRKCNHVPLFGTEFDYVELSDYPLAVSRT